MPAGRYGRAPHQEIARKTSAANPSIASRQPGSHASARTTIPGRSRRTSITTRVGDSYAHGHGFGRAGQAAGPAQMKTQCPRIIRFDERGCPEILRGTKPSQKRVARDPFGHVHWVDQPAVVKSPRPVDDPGTRECRSVSPDLHVPGEQPMPSIRDAVGALHRGRVGVDQVGLFEECGIAAIVSRPVARVSRDDEVAGTPEVERALSGGRALAGPVPHSARPRSRDRRPCTLAGTGS